MIGRESLPGEERVEVDPHAGQGDRLDDAVEVLEHGVLAVWLAAPGGHDAAEGVDALDFLVAAALVLGKLGIHVVAARGRGPNFDDER